MAELVKSTYPIFTDIDGTPLEDGYIFIGVAGADPEVSPQQAYWDLALTVPADNIRTKSGYPANSGIPNTLYTAAAYSILVKNKRDIAVYSYKDSFVGPTADASSLSGATLSTDGTLSSDSDTLIPTEKAVKTYSDTKVSLSGAESVAGVKTFSSIPIVPTNPIISGATGAVQGGDVYTYVYDIGEKKTFFTSKDRSSKRLLPFDYNNPVSTLSTYADLYTEVGDSFLASHIAVGDASLGANLFYPTPPPSAYGRVGIPDISFTESSVSSNLLTYSTPTGFRGGTVFRYEILTGTTIVNLVDGTEYFLRRVSSTTVSIHTTEANAIANTSPIAISGGSGTFRLTQEGISLDDRFQGWQSKIVSGVTTYYGVGRAPGNTNSGGALAGHIVSDYVNVAQGSPLMIQAGDDGTNGTPRTTNETRPRTFYEFSYIRY